MIPVIRCCRRRLLARRHKVWTAYHSSNNNSTNGEQHDILEDGRMYRGVLRTPNVSPQRSLRHAQRKTDTNSAHRPWLRGTDRTIQSSGAGGKPSGFRLSWPLRSKKLTKAPPFLGGTRLNRLSPITESPIPRSISTPELSPVIREFPPSVLGVVVKSRTQQDLNQELNIGKRSQSRDTRQLAFERPNRTFQSQQGPKQDHLRGIRRWKSDSYKLQGSTTVDRPIIFAEDARFANSRLRVTSLYNRTPGCTPVEPLPSLPTNAWTSASASVAPGSIHGKALPATPSSFVSAGTSILDGGISPLKLNRGSWTSEVRIMFPSPVSSRTSRELSIYEQEPFQSEIPLSTGLTSPSKNRLLQSSQENDNQDNLARSSTERRRCQMLSSGQMIRNGTRVSLATLGRRDSFEPESILVEDSANPLTNAPYIGTWDSSSFSQASPTEEMEPESAGLSSRHSFHPGFGSTPLQDVSGNNPDPFLTRLYSQGYVRTSQGGGSFGELRAKSFTSPARPVSVLKKSSGRKNGHKRQNCVRISNAPPLILGPGSCSPIYEEYKPSPPGYLISPLTMNANRPPTRPLSQATYDPQVSPTPRRISQNGGALSSNMLSPPRAPPQAFSFRDRDPTKHHSGPPNTAAGIGSPGPSIPSSPPSSLPRPVLSVPRFTFTATGIISPPRALKAVKEPSPPRPPPFEFPKQPHSDPTTPSPRKHRSSAVLHGPRDPPAKVSRMSRSTDIHDSASALALRRGSSGACTPAGSAARTSAKRPLDAVLASPDRRVMQAPARVSKSPSRRSLAGAGAGTSASPSEPSERRAFRDSRSLRMPYPTLPGRTGLGISWDEELYDQNGFLRSESG